MDPVTEYQKCPSPKSFGALGLFNAFLPGLASSANLSAKKTKTSVLWHFASNIYRVLEFAKAIPSHLSLVPQESPQLHPQKVSGLLSSAQARGPKSQMTDGDGLTIQAT